MTPRLAAVLQRADLALAAVEKRGVSSQGFHSPASVSAADLRALVELARLALQGAP